MSDVVDMSRSAWRQMEMEWQEAQEAWRDSTCAYFEREYWDPLTYEVADYVRALDALLEELEAARYAVR